jgi:hypothetical protein
MKFEVEDDVSHPRDDVYGLIRDDMPLLLPYLNDVDAIIVLESKQEEGGLRILNEWRGSAAAAPAVVRKFLKPETLSWKDHAFWPEGGYRAEWRLEPKVGGSLFDCSGTTSVLAGDTPGACKIRIQGNLNVYPERLPGVPRLLAGRMRGKIESFVVGMILPNMQTMSRGVQGYFDDKQREAGAAT